MFILRALLGISEAGFSPGLPFYLSFFYKRNELALRTGLVVSAAPLATSFAGSLAWLITKLGSAGPIAPWRLLFLVEGFPTICFAFVAWMFVPDGPGTAGFLNNRQRKIASCRMKLETADSSNYGSHRRRPRLDWREILETLWDPQCYLTAVSVPCIITL